MEKAELKTLIKQKGFTDFDEVLERKIKALQLKSSRDTFALGELFIEAFSKLNEDFPNEKSVQDKLKAILKMNDLRNLFDDYGDGKEYGSYWAGLKIKDFINEQRDKIQQVVNLFNKLYSDSLI